MINADSYYEIGSGHTFNQDYADSGFFDAGGSRYYYAVVADGCSGSKDSDIGARILAKTFAIAAKAAFSGVSSFSVQENIQNALIERIELGIEGVSSEAFDATVVGIVYDQKNDTLHQFMWGDGHIMLARAGSPSQVTSVKYDSNAPFYLSYKTDVGREILYEQHFGEAYGTLSRLLVVEDKHVVDVIEAKQYKVRNFYEVIPKASTIMDFAMVMTDGVDTYHHKTDVNKPAPMHNIFNQYALYKNTHGEFVKRRMLKVKQFVEKEGWQHFDDISVATISIK